MLDPAWTIGRMVECVESPPDSSFRFVPPIEAGRRYRILKVRDPDLGPPKGPVPKEILVDTTFGKHRELALWWHVSYFRLVTDS